MRFAHLPENKSCNVSGLPVGGVKKVRQSHCGEGSQHIRAVQGIIHPLRAPPATGNWNQTKIDSWKYMNSNLKDVIEKMRDDRDASFPLTVSNGVSQLAHGANRRLTFHTGHAGSTTSLLSSSVSPGLGGGLGSRTSRSLIAFQKHVLMLLDCLRWGIWEKEGKKRQGQRARGRGMEMLWSHNNWLVSIFKSIMLFCLIR